jgi:hypothetical protein
MTSQRRCATCAHLVRLVDCYAAGELDRYVYAELREAGTCADTLRTEPWPLTVETLAAYCRTKHEQALSHLSPDDLRREVEVSIARIARHSGVIIETTRNMMTWATTYVLLDGPEVLR